MPGDTRRRQQRLAEITELIHVASLLHDDVLDSAATRRGLRALNLEVGNKLAILAGDFLLARASVTLASLRNTEVIELLSRVLEHLVTGEVMQMTAKADRLVSFDHYFKKTYFKTASLIANSAKVGRWRVQHPCSPSPPQCLKGAARFVTSNSEPRTSYEAIPLPISSLWLSND